MYALDPLPHRLITTGEDVPPGPTTLVISGVPQRTAWKYRASGFRHLCWDCDTMLSQLHAVAPPAREWMGFDDEDRTALIGAGGIHESPLVVVHPRR